MPFLFSKKSPGFTSVILCLFVLLQLHGCALKPWKTPIIGQQQDAVTPLTETLLQRQSLCGKCVDGTMKISLKSGVGERALSGYFLTMKPDKLKFIAHNPLGQPIFAASGDHNTFHYLNTIERRAFTGKTESLFRELGLPIMFASPSWPAWLTAEIPANNSIVEMRTDRQNRGIWITYQNNIPDIQEHLLLDANEERILSRIVTNGEKTVLQLDYEHPHIVSGCSVPTTIRLSNYDLTTETVLELSELEVSDTCTKDDFTLPTPSGYSVREF